MRQPPVMVTYVQRENCIEPLTQRREEAPAESLGVRFQAKAECIQRWPRSGLALGHLSWPVGSMWPRWFREDVRCPNSCPRGRPPLDDECHCLEPMQSEEGSNWPQLLCQYFGPTDSDWLMS